MRVTALRQAAEREDVEPVRGVRPHPVKLADRLGDIYGALTRTNEVWKWDNDGGFITSWYVYNPQDIAVDRHGDVFVTTYRDQYPPPFGYLTRFDSDGGYISRFGAWGGSIEVARAVTFGASLFSFLPK